jgi:hypothetical protein
MDEDYARRLRNWLRAEPGATPRQAAEEREWLRGIPEPGSATDERGRPPGERLPGSEPAADDGWPVDRRLARPGRPGRAGGGDESADWRLALPEHDAAGGWVSGGRLPESELAADDGWPVDRLSPPEPAAGGGWLPGGRLPAPQPGSDETWSVRGQLPAAHPAAHPAAADDDEWICPVIALPVPRPSRENGCRMSEAEARSRRNHPSGRLRDETAERRMSEAEARSRWNHPTNWHRRRQAEEQQRDHPGSR